MIRDGERHIESLRDGRQIYIDGELVENHVDHPAFKKSILSAAALYDYQAEPKNMEQMTFASPETGDRINRMWQLPRCYGELVERRKALEAWAGLCGFLGRSPDHVASALSGMYMGLDLFQRHGGKIC